MKKKFVFLLLLCSLILLSACNKTLSTSTNNTIIMNSAELVDDQNRSLIGTSIQDNSKPPISSKEPTGTTNNSKKSDDLSSFESSIAKKLASLDMLSPNNITEFETTDKITPEIIMTNGNAAIFSKKNYKGWTCNKGDILMYQFEKFPSEVSNSQTLIIGYVLDGVLYPGEEFKELDGTYQLKITKGGDYYIYLISATSDYLALKKGTIFLSN